MSGVVIRGHDQLNIHLHLAYTPAEIETFAVTAFSGCVVDFILCLYLSDPINNKSGISPWCISTSADNEQVTYQPLS